MPRIVITLEITDPETVAEYREVDPEIIGDDLEYGALMRMTELVSVEVED